MHLPEPRLPEFLLASIIKAKIIFTAIIRQARGTENHYRLIYNPHSAEEYRKPMTTNPWPPLLLAEWKDTYETLHRWTQIVGKIRLTLTPHVNHWWNTTLHVTPRGLTTSIMPYKGRYLEIDFDFIAHLL